MASPTSKLGLLKPLNHETYDVNLINQNLDEIDAAFGSLGTHREIGTSLAVGANVAIDTHDQMNAIEYRAQRVGNWCYLRILVTTKIELPVSVYGALASGGEGFRICTLLPKWRPLIATPMATLGTGRAFAGYASAGLGIECNFVMGQTPVAVGDSIELVAWYMLADDA